MCPISSLNDIIDWFDRNQSSRIQYLVLLILNPKNLTNSGKILLNNFSYLNLRTRKIHFFLPGMYEINLNIIEKTEYSAKQIIEETSDSSCLMFDANGFADSIGWLESSLDGFSYDEGTHLIVIDISAFKQVLRGFLSPVIKISLPNTHIERENFVHWNLDELEHNGFNPARALSVITARLEDNNCRLPDIRYCLEGVTRKSENRAKIFIAGSKYLDIQRNYVKSELLRIQNRTQNILDILTFEDFDDSFIEGGRQEQYNDYIRNKADYVIFVLDGKVGGITLDEFKIAMRSFQTAGHPKIFVYSKIYDEHVCNPEQNDALMQIEHIKSYCTDNNQYYTEYRHDSELPLYVYRSLSEILR